MDKWGTPGTDGPKPWEKQQVHESEIWIGQGVIDCPVPFYDLSY